MSLFGISDLHLSIEIDKKMDIFSGWEDYTTRLKKNWLEKITEEDTVVLGGDFCWAKTMQEGFASFMFIERLPGQKIFLKGNHDYWWNTITKMEKFWEENGIKTLSILHNNYFVVSKVCVCGTRGWMFENNDPFTTKIINREVNRLETSIISGLSSNLPIITFLHYPPIFGNQICTPIVNILKKYGIKKCYYGHLHGNATPLSTNGIVDDIEYRLISADYVNFEPIKIA